MIASERTHILALQIAILIFVAVALAISWGRRRPVTRIEVIGLTIVAGSVCWHAWRLARERRWQLRR